MKINVELDDREVTELAYLGAFKGSYTKSGRLSAKGMKRVVNKRPLIGVSRLNL